jgi:hypothetical protein
LHDWSEANKYYKQAYEAYRQILPKAHINWLQAKRGMDYT